MPFEVPVLWIIPSLSVGAVLYILGGIRFRRWVVEDRPGIPRYPASVETVMLWLIYSVGISITIVIALQTLRRI